MTHAMTPNDIVAFVHECTRHIKDLEAGVEFEYGKLLMTFSDDNTNWKDIKTKSFASAHERMRAQPFLQPFQDFLEASKPGLEGFFNPIREVLKNGEVFDDIDIGFDIINQEYLDTEIYLYLPMHAIVGGRNRSDGPRYDIDDIALLDADLRILMGLRNDDLKMFRLHYRETSLYAHGQSEEDVRNRASLVFPYKGPYDSIICTS